MHKSWIIYDNTVRLASMMDEDSNMEDPEKELMSCDDETTNHCDEKRADKSTEDDNDDDDVITTKESDDEDDADEDDEETEFEDSEEDTDSCKIFSIFVFISVKYLVILQS